MHGCPVPLRPAAARWLLCLTVLLLTGCSVTPGRGLTLFPSNNRLLDVAKELRQSQSQPADLPRELDKQVLAPYTVEPGDVLFVQLSELDTPIRLPGDQPVLLDGTINLGPYGQLVVAGKTVPAVEADVRAAIQARTKKDPGPVTARVVTRASKVYYVLGEVNAPGTFPLNGRETVLDGIIAAGGLNDKASRRHILLSRPTPACSCRVVLPVCYREIVQLGDTSTNYQLAPGDRIYVPSRTLTEQLFSTKQRDQCGPCGGPQSGCQLPPLVCPECGHGGPPNPFAGPYSCPQAPARLPHGTD
jgi:protein involved in polysaccharide export with SLBB domain